ncbi:hypothetical protein TI03_06395, partial [Achromatium sp. WMS1]
AELDQYAKDLLVLNNGQIVKHCVVADSSQQKRTIMLRCRSGEEKIAAIIQTENNITGSGRNKQYFCLDFNGKEADMGVLLKKLIDAEVEVIEFFIKTEGMQEQYLKTIQTGFQSHVNTRH